MKIILTVLILFTAHLVHAQEVLGSTPAPANEWYTFESESCSNGEEFQRDLSQEKSTSRFKISEDLSKITIETTINEEVESEDYTMTLMGKQAYLASPASEQNVAFPLHFYVSTGEIPTRIVISKNDHMGSHCNGGLVVTTLVK